MSKGLSDLTPEERARFNKDLGILFVLLGFLVICYVSAGFMQVRSTDNYVEVLPSKGGLYGPFKIEEDQSSVMFKIRHTVGLNSFDWDSLDIEILDENKFYMSSFGAEFWKETGRDSDGRWTATQYKAELAYFFHHKGLYYLDVKVQSSHNRASDAVFAITVRQQIGSGEIFFKVGFWMLWITGAWFLWTFRRFEGDD